MVAASTHSITISWWLENDVEGQKFIAKCRKKTGGDEISEELEIVPGPQQTHMIDYLSSNTTYLIGIYIGSTVYLPEVQFKTKAKCTYYSVVRFPRNMFYVVRYFTFKDCAIGDRKRNTLFKLFFFRPELTRSKHRFISVVLHPRFSFLDVVVC
jgi:hypothetical protein